MLADSFAAVGFVPMIDDAVVSATVLENYRAQLTARPLGLVQLLPTLETVLQRDARPLFSDAATRITGSGR